MVLRYTLCNLDGFYYYNLFSSSISWEGSLSENKALRLKHGLKFNFCFYLYTSSLFWLLSQFLSHSTLSSLCSLFPLCFSFLLSSLFSLLMFWVPAQGQVKPGPACLVTAILPLRFNHALWRIIPKKQWVSFWQTPFLALPGASYVERMLNAACSPLHDSTHNATDSHTQPLLQAVACALLLVCSWESMQEIQIKLPNWLILFMSCSLHAMFSLFCNRVLRKACPTGRRVAVENVRLKHIHQRHMLLW